MLEEGDSARAQLLVKAVEDFALIERGAIRPGGRHAQQALRVGRLCLARRLITHQLSEPSLSPAMVAGLLGVSVRYMHLLFEATGTSFSHTVADERMRLSRRLLRERPAQPIAQIAHTCGFASLATFYRVFNAAHGLPPGEFRAQGSPPGPVVAVPAEPPKANHLTAK
ncbi:helix-turn-helix domain-containing protein [Bradyrhizobium erythrophlei]|uniref:helix-turn-helix domain-containing protein n=1 Tax=Bradyrhizobium erythrophlei TaxID=1437360 RepID=UPI0035E4EEBE